MQIVQCKNLTKVYGVAENQVTALKDVSFSIAKGEWVALTGASGSGKSTLLHILGSIEKPTTGSVSVDGIDVTALNVTEAAIYRRRQVGLVYQFYNLIPTLTVKENIDLPRLLDKQKPEQAFIDAIIQTLNLEDKLSSMPHQLSGGQQQRVAVARALSYRPKILLADEPTGNLDQKNSQEMLALLKQFNRELGQTVLIVTHDEKIAGATDRIITLEDGKIVADHTRG